MIKWVFWLVLISVVLQNAVNGQGDQSDVTGASTPIYITMLESAGKFFTVPMVGLWLLTKIKKGTFRRPSAYVLTMFTFILWGSITYFWSLDPDNTLYLVTRYLPYALTTYILWDIVRTQEQIEKLILAYVTSGYLIVLAMVPNYLAGYTFEGGDRYSALGLNPDDLAFILAIIIPIAWNYAVSNSKATSLARIVCYLYPTIALAGIILSGTRGGIVDAIPSFLYMLCTLKSFSFVSKGLFMLGVVAAIAFAFTSPLIEPQISRLMTITVSANSSDLNGRPDIWRAVWKEYSKRPFFGVGMGAEPEATRHYAILHEPVSEQGLIAHNVYLSVLAEEGLPGFFVLLTIFMLICWNISRLAPGGRSSWVAALASFAVGISSLALEMRWQFWIFLAVTAIATSKGTFRSLVTAPARAPNSFKNFDSPHELDGFLRQITQHKPANG